MILSVWTLLKLRFKFKPCRALINDNDKDAVNSLEHLIVHTMPQSADVILQSKITRTHRSCSNDTYQRVSTPRTIVTVKAYRFDGPYNSVVFVLYRRRGCKEYFWHGIILNLLYETFHHQKLSIRLKRNVWNVSTLDLEKDWLAQTSRDGSRSSRYLRWFVIFRVESSCLFL